MAAGQVILDKAIAMVQTEEDAVEIAVREHARLVYRIAYSVLRNHHDAEDATQETLVKVLRSRRKLNCVEDPRALLARIAWRVAVGRRRRPSSISLEQVPRSADRLASCEAADETLMRGEMVALLGRLIPALPRKLRDVITLSTVAEMSSADIASVLAINEAAVRSRLFRARQILRDTADLAGKDGGPMGRKSWQQMKRDGSIAG